LTRSVLWFLAAAAVIAAGCAGEREAPAQKEEAAAEEVEVGSFVILGPDDRRLPAGVAVYEPGEHAEPRWEGLAGEEYELEGGEYDVLVEYFGQKYWQRGVGLEGGEKIFKLPMATLAVESRSSRGDRLEGRLEAYPAGAPAGPAAIEGETFEGLPLLAGTYDVRVALQGRERWLRGVELQAGDRVTRTLVEPVGYLRVEVVDQDGEALDAGVWVYGPASGHEPVALGRSDRPIAVLPGRYDVAVRWGDSRDYSSGIAVLENQTTVERFTFWRSEAP
jgi:hypothetical protein